MIRPPRLLVKNPVRRTTSFCKTATDRTRPVFGLKACSLSARSGKMRPYFKVPDVIPHMKSWSVFIALFVSIAIAGAAKRPAQVYPEPELKWDPVETGGAVTASPALSRGRDHTLRRFSRSSPLRHRYRDRLRQLGSPFARGNHRVRDD